MSTARGRRAGGARVFGIGMQEIVLIFVIALVVVGPKKMPELARALGKGYGEFRRAFDEMKRTVDTDFQTDEIRRTLLDLPPRPTPVAFAPPESLLTQPPSPEGATEHAGLPYPAMMDASPPPPEQPQSTLPPDSAAASGPAHG